MSKTFTFRYCSQQRPEHAGTCPEPHWINPQTSKPFGQQGVRFRFANINLGKSQNISRCDDAIFATVKGLRCKKLGLLLRLEIASLLAKCLINQDDHQHPGRGNRCAQNQCIISPLAQWLDQRKVGILSVCMARIGHSHLWLYLCFLHLAPCRHHHVSNDRSSL